MFELLETDAASAFAWVLQSLVWVDALVMVIRGVVPRGIGHSTLVDGGCMRWVHLTRLRYYDDMLLSATCVGLAHQSLTCV